MSGPHMLECQSCFALATPGRLRLGKHPSQVSFPSEHISMLTEFFHRNCADALFGGRVLRGEISSRIGEVEIKVLGTYSGCFAEFAEVPPATGRARYKRHQLMELLENLGDLHLASLGLDWPRSCELREAARTLLRHTILRGGGIDLPDIEATALEMGHTQDFSAKTELAFAYALAHWKIKKLEYDFGSRRRAGRKTQRS